MSEAPITDEGASRCDRAAPGKGKAGMIQPGSQLPGTEHPVSAAAAWRHRDECHDGHRQSTAGEEQGVSACRMLRGPEQEVTAASPRASDRCSPRRRCRPREEPHGRAPLSPDANAGNRHHHRPWLPGVAEIASPPTCGWACKKGLTIKTRQPRSLRSSRYIGYAKASLAMETNTGHSPGSTC